MNEMRTGSEAAALLPGVLVIGDTCYRGVRTNSADLMEKPSESDLEDTIKKPSNIGPVMLEICQISSKVVGYLSNFEQYCWK